ncbi:hypothetical protein CP98_04976 [Sphingobium yanoikuyae]|uniref:Uncharacterized protein n=1 Tax=Sphingobium yanoikuyae TaxID=13690 RepID=A0A084E6C9_SPHYA|nr:hypothetical protein [Sphingobium yanoikuyae]KEZ13521.1 hypothetical protein CP98_04976 [Sphingobium yanoikuyae]
MALYPDLKRRNPAKGALIGLPISLALWAPLIAVFALTGCAQNLVTCPNARAAAMVATEAVARICPVTFPEN